MKKEKKVIDGNCDGKSGGCNANYLLLGIVVIFLVMFVATTIK
jgi:hypothetical protein